MNFTLDAVVGLIAPQLCISCGSEGSVLCDSCLLTAGEPIEPRCAGCHCLSKDYKTCKSCRSWLHIHSVYVATVYDGVYEMLIQALKFDLMRQASIPIAKMMASMIQNNKIFLEDYVLCPLPTAPKRIRERGFDHTKLISEQISKELRVSKPKQLLGRKTNVRQLGSTRSQRLTQMEKEFYVKRPKEIIGKNVLIIDDVTTTGASLSAASSSLTSSGAKRVYGLVFAQKIT